MSAATFEPAYRKLHRERRLFERARKAIDRLHHCDLCARYCHVDRHVGIRGAVCRSGRLARVASYGAHHGEERPLSGRDGSGTIFFSWCSLRCEFCQNCYTLSSSRAGAYAKPTGKLRRSGWPVDTRGTIVRSGRRRRAAPRPWPPGPRRATGEPGPRIEGGV